MPEVYTVLMMKGSSPLTRGKLIRRDTRKAQCGLIPAHAGKTLRLRKEAPRERAHPRSRGENTGGIMFAIVVWGSSPLTRGKQCETQPTQRLPGLIPAHAGKTLSLFLLWLVGWAHPRSRGENKLVA